MGGQPYSLSATPARRRRQHSTHSTVKVRPRRDTEPESSSLIQGAQPTSDRMESAVGCLCRAPPHHQSRKSLSTSSYCDILFNVRGKRKLRRTTVVVASTLYKHSYSILILKMGPEGKRCSATGRLLKIKLNVGVRVPAHYTAPSSTRRAP